MKLSFIGLASLLFLLACGGSDSGSSSDNSNPPSTTSTSVETYLTEAQFYWDQNKNSVPDDNEPLTTLTDELGNASFSVPVPEGSTIRQLKGGLDEGIPDLGGLSAKIDSNVPDPTSVVITPLTTLLSEYPELNASPTILLDLINNSSPTYYDFELKDLYSNPMTFKDGTLLNANLSAINSVWANIPDLGDGSSIGTNTNFYSDFKKNTEIYSHVLKDFSSNPKLAGKMGATFSNYINQYTNAGFVVNSIPTQDLFDAILEVEGKMGTNTSSFSPVVLIKDGTAFKALMLDTANWIPTGDYYSIGIKTLISFQRPLLKTVGSYNSPPLEIELNFGFYKNNEDSGFEIDDLNLDTENYLESFGGIFDKDHFTYTLTQGLTNKDGKRPKTGNIETKLGLPLYAKNWSSNEVLRSFPLDLAIRGATETYYTVIGEGIETRHFYGINVNDAVPNRIDFWKTDYSRANNCLEGITNPIVPQMTLDYSCKKETGNLGNDRFYIKYKADAEKISVPSINTFIPTDSWKNVGSKPPSSLVLKIMPPTCFSSPPLYNSIPNCPSPGGAPTTLLLNISASQFGELDILPNGPLGSEFRVKTGSVEREIVRSGSSGLSIGVHDCMTPSGGCYDNNILVNAINSISMGAQQYQVANKSGFFRNGLLFLDLKGVNSTSGVPSGYDFLILNFATRSGFAFPTDGNRSLQVNNIDIFNYQSVSKILIEKFD